MKMIFIYPNARFLSVFFFFVAEQSKTNNEKDKFFFFVSNEVFESLSLSFFILFSFLEMKSLKWTLIGVVIENKSANTTFTLDITCTIDNWSGHQAESRNIATCYHLKCVILCFVPFPMAFRFEITSNPCRLFSLCIWILSIVITTICILKVKIEKKKKNTHVRNEEIICYSTSCWGVCEKGRENNLN